MLYLLGDIFSFTYIRQTHKVNLKKHSWWSILMCHVFKHGWASLVRLCDIPLSAWWRLLLAALNQCHRAPFYSWRGSSHSAPHCLAQSANRHAAFFLFVCFKYKYTLAYSLSEYTFIHLCTVHRGMQKKNLTVCICLLVHTQILSNPIILKCLIRFYRTVHFQMKIN